MANPFVVFFSRLAPEDKQFIKRIGVLLFILLVVSAIALFVYTHFEEKSKKDLEEQAKFATDSNELNIDSLPIPEIPGVLDSKYYDSVTTDNFNAKDLEPSYEDNFDEQAHLELMRQNVNSYNYKMAYKHGNRIKKYLLKNEEYSVEWGHVLLENGKPKDALIAFEKISSDSAVVVKTEIAIDMALAMQRSGNADSAIKFLDEKFLETKDLNLLALKASIIGDNSDFSISAKADSIFKYALKTDASVPSLNYRYGRYLMQKGDFKNSEKYLKRALQLKLNNPMYAARLGMALFYLKDDKSAETLYKRALKINPYDYNTWFNLGELYLSRANETANAAEIRNKKQEALKAYSKAIEIDSLHAKANYRIGIILNGNSQHKEAIKHLNIALEKMPHDISIMQQLSSVYLALKDTTESLNYLNKILHIDPFNKIAANELKRLIK